MYGAYGILYTISETMQKQNNISNDVFWIAYWAQSDALYMMS